MKAVLLRGYGDVEQLEYADTDEPVPHAGEVLVAVISTSVNPIDYKIQEGVMKDVMHLFPAILGRDVAGRVVGLGPGVTQFKVGDHVMGATNQTYAELLSCKADELTHIPQGLDVMAAGALPLVLITGAQLIERGLVPGAGERVLVTGAAGSVGRTAVYVAKQRGCRVIAGVKASQKSEANSLGADQVVALDSDSELASLPELDGIADTINGSTAGVIAKKLVKGGKFASVLGKPDAAVAAGVTVVPVFSQPDPKRLHELASDIQAGRFTIPISQTMRLSEIRQAHTAAEKGARGKVVLIP